MRTGTAPPPPGGTTSPSAPFIQPPAPKTRRQPALVALGVALIGASAAGFAYWNHKADTKSSVLMLARDVPYGQKLTAADLKVTDVALAPGMNALSADSLTKVTTEVATTSLHAGSLLTPADIATAPPLPPNTDLISFNAKPDSIPAGLTVGRTVTLVAHKVWKVAITDFTSGQNLKLPPADAYPSDPVVFKATIVEISGTHISVAVAQSDAVIAEQIGADDKLGIVLLPAGS